MDKDTDSPQEYLVPKKRKVRGPSAGRVLGVGSGWGSFEKTDQRPLLSGDVVINVYVTLRLA